MSKSKEFTQQNLFKDGLKYFGIKDKDIAIEQANFAIRDDYDIYLRHYTEGTDETIMFFMPKLQHNKNTKFKRLKTF